MKPLVAIFAHPDDEAFGPAGTLTLEARKRDVYIIVATGGEAGKNSHTDRNKSLSELRHEEALNSAKILGIKKVFFLNFEDGKLSNSLYHIIAQKIETILNKIQPDTLMTYEPHGVSGHIDHMAMSMITTFEFSHLSFIRKLLYYCIEEHEATHFRKDYFIYFPRGYKTSEIDKTIDITDVWSTKTAAMHAHVSQKHDAERIIKFKSNRDKKEHFLVKKK